MRKRIFLPCVLLFTALTLAAKEKPAMPIVVTNATYVMVTTYDGDILSPQVSQDDRKAVQDVQQALEKWGRYKLVYRPGEADLFLVVRTARSLELRGSAQKGTGPGAPRGSAQSITGQNGDPQDTLDVYVSSRGIDNYPIWRSRAVDGFKSPELKLLNEFRSEVETAAKKH
ncbi:MAG TPA: hypothetical protein VMH31_16670 [Methylomirabilota bacterium]|nr:hypothetical protein [Methylomirabilota bacterium]